jgi:multiple sugar transport system substrate-binding protein
MKQYVFKFCIILILLALLVGCGKSGKKDEGPVTVSVWFHSGKGEERDVLNAQIKDFNSMQDNIVIEAVQLPEGTYNEQVQAAAVSNELPDLLDFDGPNLYNYAWAGHLISLNEFITDELRKDFLPSILAQGNYNGKIYALGTFDSGLAIWANKAYLEKAGVRIPGGAGDEWTGDEFLDVLSKLQALPEVEYAIDLKMNYGAGEWFTYGFSPIIQSFGGGLIDRTDYQSADGVLNSPESVAALEFIQSLFEKNYTIVQPAGDDDFYGRKIAALSYVGHWMWTPHHEGLKEDLLLLPMPKFGDKTVAGMGSWCWGITANAKNRKAAAWEFLKYLLEPEQIIRMTNANGAVPARKSALAMSELYKEDGPLRIFADQLNSGIAVPRPNTPAYPTITQAFSEALNNIIRGSEVKTELDKAVEKIDQDIKDNKGYPVE